jgi:hypothetical protein
MADNDRKPETSGADINPGSRENLRKAADELLKADRAARRRAAAEDADAYAAFGEEDGADEAEGAVFGDMDTDSAAAGSIIAEEIEAIQAENSDMKDRLLRLAADMENLRRRTQLGELRRAMVVAVVASVERIQQVRQNRILTLNAGGFENETYVDRRVIAREIAVTRKICAEHGWPLIDVTRRSIEETAAEIMALYRTHKSALANGGVA